MPLEKEKQGLKINDYQERLSDGTRALRIGKEVPEGDVNLAYVHTPQVQVDENISLVDTSYTSGNVIPQDQLESMVAANAQGELEYVDIIGNNEIRPRPPKNIFPSNKVKLTRKFKKGDLRTENALYYKFEIHYHYDSIKALPNEKGEFDLVKYQGQQIELTDENGNLLNDFYKYDIYVLPHADNPRIYSVVIYLNKNTDHIETFKVRYNHIDKVVKDEDIQSVRNEIEFYTNSDNSIIVNDQEKQMLEGGKLRIINAGSAFEEKTELEVQEALMDSSNQEVFAVVPKVDGEGYKIVVSQKSEDDPRSIRIFSHRIVAEYRDEINQTIKVTVGHITDWVINSEALMESERKEYSGEWKHIGLPNGTGKITADQMIEMSLPFGAPSIPSNATYYIEDDQGNLLYHIQTLTDNPNVETRINETMSHSPEAKANDLHEEPWKNAISNNSIIKSNPIPHRATIIPERQKTKWNFSWTANGQGYTEYSTDYKTNWQVCANVGFKKTNDPYLLDVTNSSKWGSLGSVSVSDWRSYLNTEHFSSSKNVIELQKNEVDVAGFFHKVDNIGGTNVDLMQKQDYEFSVKVKTVDPHDDDVIGIMFRVKNSKEYYMFAWESERLMSGPEYYLDNEIPTYFKNTYPEDAEKLKNYGNGAGKIIFDERGCAALTLRPSTFDISSVPPEKQWYYNTDYDVYKSRGFGSQKKRIFKVTPTAAGVTPHEGYVDYAGDKTGCSFYDITDQSGAYYTSLGQRGWEYNKEYKITVRVTGSDYRIYISENPNSEDLGTLVCRATDSTYSQGTYGIFCASQRWTMWSDLKMTEIQMETVCSDKKEVTFTDNEEKKLSNYAAPDLLESKMNDLANTSYGGASYEVMGYSGRSDGDASVWVNAGTKFIYGKTNNSSAGGITQTPWTTEESGLSVEGVGTVEYFPDGHFDISLEPPTLPTDEVPEEVLGFTWNQPLLTSGENVSISLEGIDQIKVTATVPAIELIGTPYVLPMDMILKDEGVKSIANLFDHNGVYSLMNIPEDIPMNEVLLRIERGEVTGINSNGAATVINPEYRVNYRFRCQRDGFIRLPVDQFQNQLGVNRLRLSSVCKSDGERDPSILIDLVAWTTFEELESSPLFAIKIDEDRKIEIEKPKVSQESIAIDNWYLRVKNGRFHKRIALPYHEVNSPEKVPEIYVSYPELLGMVTSPNHHVEVDLEYTLPEYTNQEFYNGSTILVDKESPVILNEYAIQTRYSPLVMTSLSGDSYLEVYSIRNNRKRSLRVSDVDTVKGIIYLIDRIREQDHVYVRYAYKEDWYTYRGFEKEQDFFHLDLNPTPGHYHTVAQNSFHQWIPVHHNIEPYHIDPQGTSNIELLVKQIHVYLRPSAIRRMDINNLLVHGSIIEGTTKSKTLYHTDEEKWFDPKGYSYDPTMLRLGKIMLQANSTIEDHMTILDTRTRGGGLDESLSKEIIRQVNKESLYHWDIGYFDGEAYQENGVMIIRLPKSLVKSSSNPNGFHETDIQEAVAKHKAYGTLPIIEYYEVDEDESRYNIIPNAEFNNGKNIGYYDESKSAGTFDIPYMKVGAGDNYVLRLKAEDEYAITLPGHLFQTNSYRLDIKALRELTATDRSAGTVDIHYNDDTVKQIQLNEINRPQWMIYKQLIDMDENIHHVTITLNKTSEVKSGTILIDYVMLHSKPTVDEITTEIHEI